MELLSQKVCAFLNQYLTEVVPILIGFSDHGELHTQYYYQTQYRGFPGGAVVGNPPARAGDTGSSPGPGRSHMPRSN